MPGCIRALGVINFDPLAIICSRLDGLSVGRRSRGTVGCRRGYRDEGEVRVYEGTCVLCGSELGEAKTLGLTFNKIQWEDIVRTQKQTML